MRRLVCFATGFTAAIAILLRAQGELRVVLVVSAGTTAVLLFILYLKRYFKAKSIKASKCTLRQNQILCMTHPQKQGRMLYDERRYLSELTPNIGYIKQNSIYLPAYKKINKKDRRNQQIYIRALIILTGFLLGALWHLLFEAYKYIPAVSLAGVEKEEDFIILDYPRHYIRSSRVFAKTGSGHKVNLLLYDIADNAELKPGDRITARVRFSLPQETRDFDFLTYYRAKGIFIDAEQTGELEIDHSKSIPVRYLPLAVRNAISDKLALLFQGAELGFVKALLTGDKSDLPQSVQYALSSAGLSHIISVSGMHVIFLVGMILFVFKRVKAASIAAVPVMLFFVAMTGAAPSAIRAFIMQSIILLARIAGREEDSLTSLGAAILVLLIINPFSIMDIGLQLSFLATLGMILFSPRMQMKVYRVLPGKMRRNPAVKFAVGTLCATISANVLTLFPVLHYFGKLPLVSPVSNLLSLWIVSLVFYACTLCVMLSFIWMPLAEILAVPISLGVRYIEGVASISIRFPYAVLDAANPYIFFWLAFTVLVAVLWFFGRKNRRVTRAAISVAVLALSCAAVFSELDMLDSDMTIALLDVGQGQSIVAASDAYTVMIDCGGNRYPGAGNIAADYLISRNRHKIDMIILTHTHSDHINGIKELLDNIDIEYAAVPATTACLETAMTLSQYGVKVLSVDDNYLIDMAGCSIRIFRPIVKKSDVEETMCVMLSSGEFNALITGDAAFISEKILTEREVLPDIELLVAGHHGSGGSTGEALLDALKPEVAVVSVGMNSFGHPSGQTLKRLAERGVDVYRTDMQGTVEIKVKSRG